MPRAICVAVTVTLFLSLSAPLAAVEDDLREVGAPPLFGMSNPAATYCRELGYDYETVKTPEGEVGVCVLPSGERVDAWDFYRGRVGREYSYCARLGYGTATRASDDGTGECAICVRDDGTEVGTVWDLMDLRERLSPLTFGQRLDATTISAPDIGRERDFAEAFNWCDLDGCTPVKDQGNCGSCWAFSSVATLESAIAIKDGVVTDLSEQWLLSCNSDGWDCVGGFWAHRYHLYKADPCGWTGAVYEADCEYVQVQQACDCPYEHPYKIQSWGHIAGRTGIPSVAEIKEAMLEYGPIDAAVLVDDNFSDYQGGVFSLCDNQWLPNHTVTLVGWDDTQGAQGIWILRNCWGTGWGERGFMRIEYGCSNVGYGACWANYRDPIRIELAEELPAALTPDQPTTIAATIEELTDTTAPGSALIHYRYGHGEFETAELLPAGGGVHEAVLPPADCNHSPEFYLSVDGARYGTVTSPDGAPDELHRVPVGYLTMIFADDFETHQGWSVVDGDNLIDGTWERGVPAGDGRRGDPVADYDGSGSCYLTGNEAGNSDVDGGTTRLISPALDLTAGDAAVVTYAVWYVNAFGNNPNEDVLNVYVTTPSGWLLVDFIGPETPVPVGWQVRSFAVGDHTPLSEVFYLRFDASDASPWSIVEAGIDAVTVSLLTCDAAGVPAGAGGSSSLSLHANQPNPFTGETGIGFVLPQGSSVTLTVYDASGRLVRRLLTDDPRSAGEHAVSWDGRDDAGHPAASGTYFYRLTAGSEVATRKMVLLR